MFFFTTNPFEDSSQDPTELLNSLAGKKLLEQELSKPVYQKRHSVLQEIWQSISELFSNTSLDSTLPTLSWLLLAILVICLVIVMLVFLNGEKLSPPSKRESDEFKDSAIFEDQRTAVQYLAAVHNALSRQDYVTAFLEQFRHMLRSAQTQGLISDTPGLTALEGTKKLSNSVGHETQLQWAADNFNAIRYGRKVTDASAVAKLQDLDQSVSKSANESAKALV